MCSAYYGYFGVSPLYLLSARTTIASDVHLHLFMMSNKRLGPRSLHRHTEYSQMPDLAAPAPQNMLYRQQQATVGRLLCTYGIQLDKRNPASFEIASPSRTLLNQVCQDMRHGENKEYCSARRPTLLVLPSFRLGFLLALPSSLRWVFGYPFSGSTEENSSLHLLSANFL